MAEDHIENLNRQTGQLDARRSAIACSHARRVRLLHGLSETCKTGAIELVERHRQILEDVGEIETSSRVLKKIHQDLLLTLCAHEVKRVAHIRYVKRVGDQQAVIDYAIDMSQRAFDGNADIWVKHTCRSQGQPLTRLAHSLDQLLFSGHG